MGNPWIQGLPLGFLLQSASCLSSWGRAGEKNTTFSSLIFAEPDPFGSFFSGMESSQFAGECVASVTEHLTCRWGQTVSPPVDSKFSSLSARKNYKAPGTLSHAWQETAACAWVWWLWFSLVSLAASDYSVNHGKCPFCIRLKNTMTQDASEFEDFTFLAHLIYIIICSALVNPLFGCFILNKVSWQFPKCEPLCLPLQSLSP